MSSFIRHTETTLRLKNNCSKGIRWVKSEWWNQRPFVSSLSSSSLSHLIKAASALSLPYTGHCFSELSLSVLSPLRRKCNSCKTLSLFFCTIPYYKRSLEPSTFIHLFLSGNYAPSVAMFRHLKQN